MTGIGCTPYIAVRATNVQVNYYILYLLSFLPQRSDPAGPSANQAFQ